VVNSASFDTSDSGVWVVRLLFFSDTGEQPIALGPTLRKTTILRHFCPEF
jgi:hypothetical protein